MTRHATSGDNKSFLGTSCVLGMLGRGCDFRVETGCAGFSRAAPVLALALLRVRA